MYNVIYWTCICVYLYLTKYKESIKYIFYGTQSVLSGLLQCDLHANVLAIAEYDNKFTIKVL